MILEDKILENYFNKLNEAIPLNYAKYLTKGWDRKRLDDWFNGKDRIYLKLSQSNDSDKDNIKKSILQMFFNYSSSSLRNFLNFRSSSFFNFVFFVSVFLVLDFPVLNVFPIRKVNCLFCYY